MSDFAATEHQQRTLEVEGWPIRVTSYLLGDVWICHIDNVSPGAIIARGRGDSREAAEQMALDLATRRLRSTRRMQQTLDTLHASVASMDSKLPGKKP